MSKGLSLSYSVRNLVARRLTTILTVLGLALVVVVFAAVLMLAEGLRRTLGATGEDGNVVILRRGAQTEVQSTVDRQKASQIALLPFVATDGAGRPQIAREVVLLINVPRGDGSGSRNLSVRGTDAVGLSIRPQVKLVAGRPARPGLPEIVVGSGLSHGANGLRLGSSLRFGLRDWTVVGLFDAGGSGFDSEIWGDRDVIMQTFRRSEFSTLLLKLRDAGSYPALAAALAGDRRLQVDFKRERVFYADQSEKLATFIGVLGKTITIVFSIGAMIGAMITMHASVASRTREIGTLRALGFQRDNILGAFLKEAAVLGAISGAVGLIVATLLQLIRVSTTNVQTFSEIVFNLVLTPSIVAQVFGFAVAMGVIGGVLPSLRASRLEIVDALRSL